MEVQCAPNFHHNVMDVIDRALIEPRMSDKPGLRPRSRDRTGLACDRRATCWRRRAAAVDDRSARTRPCGPRFPPGDEAMARAPAAARAVPRRRRALARRGARSRAVARRRARRASRRSTRSTIWSNTTRRCRRGRSQHIRSRLDAMRARRRAGGAHAGAAAGHPRLARRRRCRRRTLAARPISLSTRLAARLARGLPRRAPLRPADWRRRSAAELHELRQRVVDHRYQMEMVEPLWPRFGRIWLDEAERLRDRLGKYQDLAVLERLAGPHQPLARWRSRLTPAVQPNARPRCRSAPRASPRRLFAERPKAFRQRLEAMWERSK